LDGVVDVNAALADQAAADAGLLQHLADGRLIWKLSVLDVATGRQPDAVSGMVEQQHLSGLDNERGDGELADDAVRAGDA
jgi:hypothetical protein